MVPFCLWLCWCIWHSGRFLDGIDYHLLLSGLLLKQGAYLTLLCFGRVSSQNINDSMFPKYVIVAAVP